MTAAGRRGYKAGFQVSHDFVVTQNASSVESLYELREFFGVGQVYVNRRSDNHREHMHRYVRVHADSDLLGTIIPFFRQYPLRTAKRYDFEKFAYCVELMAGGRSSTRAWIWSEIVDVMRDDEPEEAQARAHQNPQRPYARRPGHRVMRWSHLHGDMQGTASKEVLFRSDIVRIRRSAKFLVG